jgi:hypothetical protein
LPTGEWVCEWLRQVVDALLGGAIDDLLAAKLKLLASGSTVAQLVRGLHRLLWPHGVWFLKVPQPVPDVRANPPSLRDMVEWTATRFATYLTPFAW